MSALAEKGPALIEATQDSQTQGEGEVSEIPLREGKRWNEKPNLIFTLVKKA